MRELRESPVELPRRALSPKSSTKRLAKHVAENPKATYTVSGQDLLSLVSLLTGPRDAQEEHLQRVRERFPELID